MWSIRARNWYFYEESRAFTHSFHAYRDQMRRINKFVLDEYCVIQNSLRFSPFVTRRSFLSKDYVAVWRTAVFYEQKICVNKHNLVVRCSWIDEVAVICWQKKIEKLRNDLGFDEYDLGGKTQ